MKPGDLVRIREDQTYKYPGKWAKEQHLMIVALAPGSCISFVGEPKRFMPKEYFEIVSSGGARN